MSDMSGGAPSAPANSSQASQAQPNSAPIEAKGNPAPQNSDAELEALENELSSSEESIQAKSSKDSAAPAKTQGKADKAAKQEGAKKLSNDRYQIKVDGENIELSRDDMVKYAQMGKAGQKRMAEAAQIKQEAVQLIEMLRNNPENVLADPAVLGNNDEVIKFAQRILAKKLEDDQKDPNVLKAEQLEKELENLRKQQKEETDKRQKEEYQRLVQQEEKVLEDGITEALDSSGLPKSPFILKRLTDVLISAAESQKFITPKQALNIVKREMQRDLKDYFAVTPEDALEQLLSADKVKNLRKRQLAKLKSQVEASKAPSLNDIKSAAKPVQAEAKSPEKMKLKDWLRK